MQQKLTKIEIIKKLIQYVKWEYGYTLKYTHLYMGLEYIHLISMLKFCSFLI